MVETKYSCDNCDREINIKIHQTIIDRNLRWSISYVCPFCSIAIESDDIGYPPEDIRQIILITEGEYQLSVTQPNLNKVKAVKILRNALDISIMEASQILKLFPQPALRGTKIEMIYLQQLFKAEGIEAEILKN